MAQPSDSTATHPAEALLKRAHPPPIAATIFQERVRQRPLHLRATSPDARTRRQRERCAKQQRENHARRRARTSNSQAKPLSAKEKRARCIYEIPRKEQKYALYEPLHGLWCNYMRGILGLRQPSEARTNQQEQQERRREEHDTKPLSKDGSAVKSVAAARTYIDANSSGQILVTADYHGAIVRVVRSRCLSRVGLQGIVVKDTKYTFEIITRSDELKVVPKEHTVFRFEVPFEDETGAKEKSTDDGDVGATPGRKPLVLEIHGKQFESRAADRANRKFRQHWDPDL